MKIWAIPESQLEKWLEWLDRQEKWRRGFQVVERLTGIRPMYLSDGGDFRFKPPPGTEIPKHFTRPDTQGCIRPRGNYLMGKILLRDWKIFEIPPVHIFCFWRHMGINPTGPGQYQTDRIGGELYVINAQGWNPEDYGYNPKEI